MTAQADLRRRARTEDDRAFDFAAALHGAVSVYGPGDLTAREASALADHLTEAASEWVKARNRAAAAPKPQPLPDHGLAVTSPRFEMEP